VSSSVHRLSPSAVLRIASILTVCLAMAWSVPAADDRADVRRALAHFERGERLFKVSRYREALEEFKEAFVIKEDPVFLYNIAQCHRLLGERTEALTFYRRYLAASPESRNRPEVERRIRELESARAAGEPPTAPPPATVTPPTPVAPVPPPDAPRSSPSPALPAVPAAAVSASPRQDEDAGGRPIYARWWFWTIVGVAVAAGVTSAIVATRPAKEPTCAEPCLR